MLKPAIGGVILLIAESRFLLECGEAAGVPPAGVTSWLTAANKFKSDLARVLGQQYHQYQEPTTIGSVVTGII